MWGTVVVVALLAVALVRVFGGYRPAPPGTQALRPRELALVSAVADAMFPAGGAIPASGRDAQVAAYLDRLVAASQPRQRALMRALFFLFEHATVFFPAPGGLRGLRRFSALDQAQREAVLERWRTSGWFVRRLCFTSLRALCTLGYFASPEVLRVLRLAPFAIDTPVCEADLWYPAIGAPRASIRLTDADLTPPSPGTPLDLDGALMAGYGETRG